MGHTFSRRRSSALLPASLSASVLFAASIASAGIHTWDVREVFSKFLLMRNLEEQIPGSSLYIMKKRGIFKTTFVRRSAPGADGRASVTERVFSPTDVQEIEYRFAALAPYLTASLSSSR